MGMVARACVLRAEIGNNIGALWTAEGRRPWRLAEPSCPADPPDRLVASEAANVRRCSTQSDSVAA